MDEISSWKTDGRKKVIPFHFPVSETPKDLILDFMGKCNLLGYAMLGLGLALTILLSQSPRRSYVFCSY